MAVNRDESWQKVTDIDTPEKLRALKSRQLRKYQRYVVEVQYQELARADDKAARNQLDRLNEEFVRRRSSWGTSIGVAALCVALIGTVVGLVRCRRDSHPTDSQRLTSPSFAATPSIQTQQPTPTQQPTQTVPETFSPTPSVTATRSPTTRKRRSPQSRRKD